MKSKQTENSHTERQTHAHTHPAIQEKKRASKPTKRSRVKSTTRHHRHINLQVRCVPLRDAAEGERQNHGGATRISSSSSNNNKRVR